MGLVGILLMRFLVRKLADIEIEEVPPYTWQLLLISRKVCLLVFGKGHY